MEISRRDRAEIRPRFGMLTSGILEKRMIEAARLPLIVSSGHVAVEERAEAA